MVMIDGQITLPLHVEVSLNIREWNEQEGTVDFDTVQDNITMFIQDALDAWLLERKLGYVER
jgi:hypothetical protein